MKPRSANRCSPSGTGMTRSGRGASCKHSREQLTQAVGDREVMAVLEGLHQAIHRKGVGQGRLDPVDHGRVSETPSASDRQRHG